MLIHYAHFQADYLETRTRLELDEWFDRFVALKEDEKEALEKDEH